MMSTLALDVLQVTLDSVPARISYWDRDGLNRFANQAFLGGFGVAQEAITGRHVREVFGEQWFARLEGAIADGLVGKSNEFDALLTDGDGQSRHRNLRFVPDQHDDRVRGLVISITDVMANQQTEAEPSTSSARLRLQIDDERQRREASDQANKAKSEFLASMSHEIRTPMNAILGLSHLALQQRLDDKPRSYIQKVHQAAVNLLGILNDILDFSRVEAGRMDLAHEPFALAEVLDRVMDTAGVRAQAKQLRFTLTVEPEVPKELIGDAMRLGQVLLNLCDNAIKFTERGQVLVQVETMQHMGKQVELLFSVADTGSGIASDLQRRVFRQFEQVDSSAVRGLGGSGLGLSICRHLVDLMGGHLGVESQPGVGSTFHFNAAFEAVPSAVAGDAGLARSQAPPTAARLPEALHGACVLLAEDNEVNQLVACEVLRGAGIEVLVAENGRQVLETLNARPTIDLVLMDCYMPLMDGFAATRAIRSQPRFHQLPVVAMTANVLTDDLLKCRGVGMNDHIGKPFLVDDLFEVLTRWIRPRR